MGSVIIVREQSIALANVRLHEAHHQIMSESMLAWRYVLPGVHLEVAVVGCLGVAQGVALEPPLDRLLCDVHLHSDL